jgi:hypothetical protein
MVDEERDLQNEPGEASFVAFCGPARIAAGTLVEVAVGARRAMERDGHAGVLVFDGVTGAVRDLDLRGSETDVAARYGPEAAPAPRRGRPKLGVVAREVTLLPRHWEWLAGQAGGASVALRRLVETARKADAERGGARSRIEAAYRFMAAMAGDLPGFEEATRALFAHDLDELAHRIGSWPPDISDQTLRFANADGDANR